MNRFNTAPVTVTLAALLLSPCELWAQNQSTDKLQGIIVVGDPKAVKDDPRTDVSGIRFESPAFLQAPTGRNQDKVAAFSADLRSKYVGRELGDLAWVTNILQDFRLVSRALGRPVVDVFFPRNADFSQGRVYVVVLEGTVGDLNVITSKENKFGKISPKETNSPAGVKLAKQLELQPGQPIGDDYTRDLERLNRQPQRRTAGLSIRPGRYAGEADVDFNVTNRFPAQIFVGYDDAGTTAVGIDRLFAGGKAFGLAGLGDTLSYQYTADLNFDTYTSHAASYAFNLGSRSSIVVYGATATVDAPLANSIPGLVGSQAGDNLLFGGQYALALSRSRRFAHEIYAGFDFKDIETTLTIGGLTNNPLPFQVAEFNLGYRGQLKDNRGLFSGLPGQTTFDLKAYFSPGGILSHDENDDYQARDGRAKAQFFVFKGDIVRETPLGQYFDWRLAGRFQYATERLLATEQLGLGGSDSVRGFETGVLLGDNGFVVRNELGWHLPTLDQRLSLAGAPSRVRLYGFADYGHVFLNHRLASEKDREGTLASVGGGVSFEISRYLEGRIDYGFQIAGEDKEKVGGSAAKDVSSRANIYVKASF